MIWEAKGGNRRAVRHIGRQRHRRVGSKHEGHLGEGGCWILELVEGLLDVCGHGDVTSYFVVVTIKGDTTIEGSSPVDGDIIQLLESLDDVVSCLFADVFDTKVVDHVGE